MPSLTVERQEDPKDIAEGHYARKQLRCKSRIIAWSHEARFRMAVSLAVSHARGKLLDYGCGDGTFLTMGEETHSSNSFAKASQEYSRWYAGGSNVSRNDDIFINHRSYHFSAVSLCERPRISAWISLSVILSVPFRLESSQLFRKKSGTGN